MNWIGGTKDSTEIFENGRIIVHDDVHFHVHVIRLLPVPCRVQKDADTHKESERVSELERRQEYCHCAR